MSAAAARFTEEYREMHNDQDDCADPIPSSASALAILEHFAACHPTVGPHRFPETIGFLVHWDSTFWVRSLRMRPIW